VNGRFSGSRPLADPQIFRGRFAPVFRFFEAHLGTLVKAAQAGSFHGRNVHEDILAAVIGLYKSIALGRVEPLHSTCCHFGISSKKTDQRLGRSPRKPQEKTRRRDPAGAYSLLGAARRAVSSGRRAPGLTIPLWPARGMVEIGRKDDSWQKPAGREPAGAAFKHNFRYLDLVVVEFEPLVPLVFEPGGVLPGTADRSHRVRSRRKCETCPSRWVPRNRPP
jgi:hypothetical protein